MRPVTVQFLKNPDILHWGFEASWLGEDDWGDWISVPTGTIRWKGEGRFEPTSLPAVFLAPRDRWWHLHYNGPHAHNYTHFVDITTPPAWVTSNRYEMIDLDLDVAVHVDGTIEVQDEDEFEIHQVKYGYSQALIDGALTATREIVAALESGSEPFFDVARSWLGKVQ
ncbi:MAG TPA: DUF402 domain-containing protein [Acidimicrobiia bacterium]|nr:DUF402 domain-containing protein [Acidimicrobiia bacterium]